MSRLTKSNREEIQEILDRRANEIARYYQEYRKNPDHFGSVELALDREIDRLRELGEKVNPPVKENNEQPD